MPVAYSASQSQARRTRSTTLSSRSPATRCMGAGLDLYALPDEFGLN